MNGNFYKRLAAAEQALERKVAGPTSRLEALAQRDPATLTDSECVEVVRFLCKLPCEPPRPSPFSPEEEAEIKNDCELNGRACYASWPR